MHFRSKGNIKQGASAQCYNHFKFQIITKRAVVFRTLLDSFRGNQGLFRRAQAIYLGDTVLPTPILFLFFTKKPECIRITWDMLYQCTEWGVMIGQTIVSVVETCFYYTHY